MCDIIRRVFSRLWSFLQFKIETFCICINLVEQRFQVDNCFEKPTEKLIKWSHCYTCRVKKYLKQTLCPLESNRFLLMSLKHSLHQAKIQTGYRAKGPFTLIVSVESCIDSHVDAWKEYIDFNCNIYTKRNIIVNISVNIQMDSGLIQRHQH